MAERLQMPEICVQMSQIPGLPRPTPDTVPPWLRALRALHVVLSAPGSPQLEEGLQLLLALSRLVRVTAREVDDEIAVGEERVGSRRGGVAVVGVDDALGDDGQAGEDGRVPLHQVFLWRVLA